MKLAPSILAADAGHFARAVDQCVGGGADFVHFDVIDGRFAPNLTFGAHVLRDLAKDARIPFDVHLMVVEPERLIDDFLAAGADRIAVHLEATTHLDRILHAIHDGGAASGVALNPATPIESIRDVLGLLDFVLVMSVNPGFSGQAFIPRALERTRRLRRLAGEEGVEIEIEMDGGIGPGNIHEVVAAGVDTCVAGSAVFGSDDPAEAMRTLRRDARTDPRP